MRDRDLLWLNRQVHYAFDSSVSSGLRANIRTAMNTIERQTCLRFLHRFNERNYIWFTSYTNDGCSSYVGQQGGSQEITLGPGCNNISIIIHEIGHALGLWHEQSRPDRDGYVQIITGNIQSGRRSQFNRRNSYEAENQGTAYDYGSVMHYDSDAFSSNGFDTIEIINIFEYNRQGRPALGASSKTELSSADATQLNRMYNCPGSGVPGILKVYVKYGRGLPDRDGWFAGDSDPYVRVKAVDDRSQVTTQETHYIRGNENPNWYRWLNFGARRSWQYFEMSTWDDDWGSDDRLYMMIRHSQLVLATTLTFNTVKIQAAQLEWSLIIPLSLMVMSAAQTHVCEELAQTSFQTIDATAPQAMVEDDVNQSGEGYASMLDMAVVYPTEMDGLLVTVIHTFE